LPPSPTTRQRSSAAASRWSSWSRWSRIIDADQIVPCGLASPARRCPGADPCTARTSREVAWLCRMHSVPTRVSRAGDRRRRGPLGDDRHRRRRICGLA
jgi:hypothetical protein